MDLDDGSEDQYLVSVQDALSVVLWQLVVPLGKVIGKVSIGISPLQLRANAAKFSLKSPQLMEVVVPVSDCLKKTSHTLTMSKLCMPKNKMY